MKCKICGFDIEEGQTSCPGCGTNVEQLKQAGNVVYEEGTTVSNTTPVTPVAEPVVEPTPVTPVAEPVAEPTPVTPVAEPVAEPTPVTPVAEPVAEPTPVTPVAEPVAEPTPVTPVTEPVVEPTPVVTPENTESPIANPVIPPIDDNTQMASLDDDKPVKEPKEHKKNKGLIITLIVILVVLLIVAGVGAYFHFIYGAPVKVFSRTVDGVKTTLNNQVPSSDVVGASFNIGFNYSDSTNSNMSFLNDLKITDATQVDKATGNSLSSIIFKYNDTDLKMNFLTKDNSSYLYAPDFFDKYLILSSADDTTSDSSLNKIDSYTEHTTELKDLITHITSALSTSVSKDYFTKTYTKETINGKSEMVAKIELTLTKEQIKTVETNFLTSIKNDDQATKDLAVLMNISAQEVKEQIDTYLSSLDITTDKLDLVLYTDLTTTKLYKGVLTSTTGDKTDTITCEVKDSNYTIVGNFASTNTTLNIDTATKSINVSTTEDTTTFGINITYNVAASSAITYPDVSDAVKSSELTEEQQNEMTSKILTNPFAVKVIGAIMSSSSSTNITSSSL